MRLPLLTALTLAACGTTVQASSFSYGVQGQAGLITSTAPMTTSASAGIHLMLKTPIRWFGGSDLRHTFELNAGTTPLNLRYDLTFIKRSGAWQYGLGAGTGVFYTTEFVGDSPFPLALYTPLLMANAHGVVGYALNDATTLEGIVRLRPGDGYQFGLRLTFTP